MRYEFLNRTDLKDLTLSFVLLDMNDTGTMREYLRVFEACFGKRANIDASVFHWLNNVHPEHRNWNFAFMNGEKLIAAYGLQPGTAFINGIEKRYALCTNVMTDPAFTGKGLFVEIGKHALQYAKEKGIDFCFGIPNENAIKGHLKVGWKEINEICFFEKTISSDPDLIADPTVFTGRLSQLKAEELTSFYGKYSFCFKRTPAWLSWRHSKPHSEYVDLEIANGPERGFMILKVYTDGKTGIRKLHMVDFGYTDISCFKKLVGQVCYLASVKNASVLNLWHYPFNREEDEVLTEKGFSAGMKNRVIVHELGKNIAWPENNWHITLYDNDVY